MEPGDVLADDVHARRPDACETLFVGPIADSGDVVEQGVEPDVDRLVGVEGNLDAPGKPLAGDGDIPELGFDQVEHLVAPALGLDEFRMSRVVRQQPVAIGREAEEVVALPRATGSGVFGWLGQWPPPSSTSFSVLKVSQPLQ